MSVLLGNPLFGSSIGGGQDNLWETSLFLKIYLFLERGEGREKERERHQCVVASCVPPTRDLACNPGMCPDWELNWQPFASQFGVQSSAPH